MPYEMITCTKCGKTKKDTEFYMKKDHTRPPFCKSCLTTFIDNKDPSTFEWILKEFDVPYIEAQWIKMYNDVMAKKGKVAPGAVLGIYLRTMNMQQFRNYTYNDTEELRDSYNMEKEEIAARLALSDVNAQQQLLILQQQLDNGEITEAEFNTRNPLMRIADNQSDYLTFAVSDEIDEDEIKAQMTEEEIEMLKRKWGSGYKPSQWVQMEDTYNKYANEYELNVDRESALVQICQLNLKMNEALILGDLNGYRQLAQAHDTLRKSAKFTDSQKDKDATRYIDSIGELVLLCEKEGDIIPKIPNPDDTPQDNVDFAIKDIKAYIYHLAVNELGMGDRIEKLIEEMKRQAEEDGDDMEDDSFILSADDEAGLALADAEEIAAEREFSDFMAALESDEDLDISIEDVE